MGGSVGLLQDAEVRCCCRSSLSVCSWALQLQMSISHDVLCPDFLIILSAKPVCARNLVTGTQTQAMLAFVVSDPSQEGGTAHTIALCPPRVPSSQAPTGNTRGVVSLRRHRASCRTTYCSPHHLQQCDSLNAIVIALAQSLHGSCHPLQHHGIAKTRHAVDLCSNVSLPATAAAQHPALS